ncbi:Chromosomal replication initiator protein DnaA [Candidatus Fokinia solitaria]|uniref:Chromosomal replication initiator protein DnaA n=1 Tax=Candidatus Fokinia solitaria TaxID=1802984 RepID=A0A2U8BR51_9RICK|nr:DnaA/Hda family protein [Candidatus Fokinia solitaria]AWD32818.1 Chromosomal replication initiator protein DnaA [Candidatus Fokinia solitaria]
MKKVVDIIRIREDAKEKAEGKESGIRSTNESLERTEENWEIVSKKLEYVIGRTAYSNWLSKIQILARKNDTVVLEAPSHYVKEFVMRHYFINILDAIRESYPSVMHVEIAVSTNQNSAVNDDKSSTFGKHSRNTSLTQPHSSYTFHNFVVGEANKVAYFMLKHLCDTSTSEAITAPSVIYLYGEHGSGKTHLLQSALCNSNSLYYTAERFLQSYVDSIRGKSIFSFKKNILDSELLLFDDVQFLCGREKTEKEFSHIVATMIEGGKHVVITGNEHPKLLPLSKRLEAILLGGMVVEIKQPTQILKMKILEQKRKVLSHKSEIASAVSDEILESIAQKTSNIREMESLLQKIVMSCEILGIEPDINLVDSISHSDSTDDISEKSSNTSPALPTQSQIHTAISAVLSYYSITEQQLSSKIKTSSLIYARQTLAFILRNSFMLSFHQIGHYMGNRTHSTVMSLYNTFKKTLQSGNSQAVSTYNHLMSKLQ